MSEPIEFDPCDVIVQLAHWYCAVTGKDVRKQVAKAIGIAGGLNMQTHHAVLPAEIEEAFTRYYARDGIVSNPPKPKRALSKAIF